MPLRAEVLVGVDAGAARGGEPLLGPAKELGLCSYRVKCSSESAQETVQVSGAYE